MTATAQGSTMRCDRAGCTNTATVEKDAWAFCADHAGTPTAPKPVAVTPRSTAAAPVAPIQSSAPMPQVVGGGTIGLLLEDASAHSSKRVQALAHRIETQLEQLRAMIAARAEDEKRKRAEAETKEKARQDIVRLEQQLAAAKAKLRKPATPKKATVAKPATDGVTTTSPHPCIDCNGPVTRPAGIVGRFPTRCTSCKAAS